MKICGWGNKAKVIVIGGKENNCIIYGQCHEISSAASGIIYQVMFFYDMCQRVASCLNARRLKFVFVIQYADQAANKL